MEIFVRILENVKIEQQQKKAKPMHLFGSCITINKTFTMDRAGWRNGRAR